MALFRIAHRLTKANERGYSNLAEDAGKRTYDGISQVYHSKWKGWPLITAWLAKNGEPLHGHIFTEAEIPGLDDLVDSFYKPIYWDPYRLDEINSQALANNIYDQAVNGGATPAIKMEQENAGVAATGIMDDITIEAINNPKSNIPNV